MAFQHLLEAIAKQSQWILTQENTLNRGKKNRDFLRIRLAQEVLEVAEYLAFKRQSKTTPSKTAPNSAFAP